MKADPEQSAKNRRTALTVASIAVVMLISYFLRKWIVG